MRKTLALSLILFSQPSSFSQQYGWVEIAHLNNVLFTVCFVDSLHGWVGGGRLANHVWYTKDGGLTWQAAAGVASACYDISMADTLRGWIAADWGIYRTEDGGRTWHLQRQDNNKTFNYSATFNSNKNITTGYTNFYRTPSILTSTDAGFSWVEEEYANFQQEFNGVQFVDSLTGYMFRETEVFKSTDGGATWTSLPAPTFMLGIDFVDSLTGWANTTHGFFRTIDGAVSWEFQSPWSTPDDQLTYYAHSFVDTLFGWACGEYQQQGSITRTTDGGWTWQRDFQLDYVTHLTDITMLDRHHGWSVSSSGHVLAYMPLTAVSETRTTTPGDFTLEQNFPNPFNPSTTIRYTIAGTGGQGPGASDVRLSVHDVLGREVAVLVNERKPPGAYETSFDATGLSSGVYLYRLSAGKNVQTRTMLIIK